MTGNIIVFNGKCIDGKDHDWIRDLRFKFRISFTLLLLLFILTLAKSQSYSAIQDINVRSGPGTQYEVIDKVLGGTKITIIENGEKWTKISTDKGEGYVSSKFIRTESDATSPQHSEKVNNNSIGAGTIIGAIVLLVLVSLGVKWIKLKAYNLLGFRSNDGNKIYECYKCNETSMFKKKSPCPNGGYHDWIEV